MARRKTTQFIEAVLRPYAMVLRGIENDLREQEPDELEQVIAACDAASETNCRVSVYQAAPVVRIMAERQLKAIRESRDNDWKQRFYKGEFGEFSKRHRCEVR